MNNLKNDEYYVRKMLNDLNFITEQMQGITIRTLGENQVLMDSMCFRLIQIQENAKKLSEEYKLSHNKIQWRDIAGLRNYIVHDYGNVDLSILFSTLTEDITFLINELEKD